MSTPQLPPDYIRREEAEATVGKSPKTIYRRIKDAIERPGKKTAGVLKHCCIQLLDGEVVAGTQIKSLTQVDDYRRQGRVPEWYIDPVFFTEYFRSAAKKTTAEVSARQNATSSTGGVADELRKGSPDSSLIEQYEKRLQEKDEWLADKDEQIRELRNDKNDLRKQISANTNLTERITSLLSHSQLAALGLPDGWQPQQPDNDGQAAHQPSEIVVVQNQASPVSKKKKRRPASDKPGKISMKKQTKQNKPAKRDSRKTAQKKATAATKQETWYNRDILSFFRR